MVVQFEDGRIARDYCQYGFKVRSFQTLTHPWSSVASIGVCLEPAVLMMDRTIVLLCA